MPFSMPFSSKTNLALLLCSTFLVLPSSAFAKDIITQSAITKVTVFPNGAEITRQATIELNENGDQVLILKGLPQHLSANSLRVEGQTTGQLEIGSVDHNVQFVTANVLDKTQRKKIEDQIEGLKDQRNLLDSKIKISQTQKQLIEGLAKLPARPVHIYGESDANKENWPSLFDMMGQKLAITYNTLHETRIARRLLSKEIDELLKKLEAQPNRQKRHSIVKVNVKVLEPAKGTITVRYQIRNAGWQPVYDARLNTVAEKPSLNLVRMASIYQHSGESWQNVKLLLSTTQPARGVTAPNLRPLSVEFAPDYAELAQAKQRRNFGYSMKKKMDDRQVAGSAMMEAPQMDKPRPAPAPVMRTARMAKAVVHSKTFQTTFEIAGKVSIAPNGQRKKLKIMDENFSPDLVARAVPKRNTNAYLYAHFELPAKATPLLAGRMFLFRDGIFVGKGYLPQIGPREKHEMGFGIDDKIKVKYAELKRNKGETGLFTSSKTDKRQFKITVKNLHDNSVKVKILDQIPYTTNEKIVIELLPTTTPPTQKNLKDKRGILSWTRTLSGGQEDVIRLDYQINWPAKSNKLIYR